MQLRFDKNTDLSKKLDVMGPKLAALILMYSATKANKIESSMKTKRPWRDRTGYAKQRLTASVSEPEEGVVRITLAHGVDYGIWLELAKEKKYAIIEPTINEEAPKIITDLRDIMSQIRL